VVVDAFEAQLYPTFGFQPLTDVGRAPKTAGFQLLAQAGLQFGA
jgi:hypothetical protein